MIYNENLTLYQAYKNIASEVPNVTAIYYYGSHISFARLTKEIEKWASILQNDFNIQKGDTVLISLPNIPQTLILLYAVNKIGGVCNMVHPHTPMEGMQKYYNEANSKVAFLFDQKVYKSLKEYKAFNGNIVLCDVQTYFPTNFLTRLFDRIYKKYNKALMRNTKFTFFRKFKLNEEEAKEVVLSKNEPSVLLHSASTTGNAKTIKVSAKAFNFTAQRVPEIICMDEKDVVGKTMISILPSFHGFGLCMTMHAPLVNGFTIALIPKFSSNAIVKAMNRLKNVICICGVPLVFKSLLNDSGFRNNRYLKNLRSCFSGGDSLPTIIKENFDSAMIKKGSGCRLFEGYGLTETLSVSVVNSHRHHKSGSVGYPLRDVEIKILDSENKEVERGVIGEIAIKGDNNMIGYYQDEEATLATYFDGYLKTGDYGYQDEDDFVYFVSRKKRVIKVSGVAVFPSQIEEVISHLPGVKGVCAIQIPDETHTHAVKVLVISDNKDKQRIIDECRKYLISWSIPKEIVFVNKLPYTKYHKVNFQKLQKEEDELRKINN